MGKNSELSFLVLKPFIAKLFLYAILLVIASNSWKLFIENRDTYTEFIDKMNIPLIVDIKFVSKTQQCPTGYNTTWKSYFPKSIAGCVCDYYIITGTNCEGLKRQANLPKCDLKKNIMSRLNNEKTDDLILRNTVSLDDQTCTQCYTDVPALTESIEITSWFQNYNLCYKVDNNQNTFTYIKSVETECDKENICNDYFCKKDNDKNNPCPITNIKVNTKKKGDPLAVAPDYVTIKNFDGNNHGFIYLPALDIGLGIEGACDKKGEYRFTSDYSLLNSSLCQISQLYSNIQQKAVSDIISYNGLEKQIYTSLPYFDQFLQDETWNLQYSTAMNRNTLFCIINNKNLHLTNAILIKENATRPNRQELKDTFSDLMRTFTRFESQSILQYNVNFTMLIVNILIVFVEVIWVSIKFLQLFFLMKHI
jgi:hypothetical protein